MPASRFLAIFTTVDTRRLADKIAAALVERRLAGCVQVVGPVTSTYRWQGKMGKAQEFLLFIKTTRVRYPAAEAAIRKLHSYETPEIIALPITTGSTDYLAWLAKETKDIGPGSGHQPCSTKSATTARKA